MPGSSLPHSLRSLLLFLAEELHKAHVDSPRLSAEVLLSYALEISRQDLLKQMILAPETVIDEAIRRKVWLYIQRRTSGEPVAYITGSKEFYGRSFTVTPDVLIPRPETELLVDIALEFMTGKGNLFFASPALSQPSYQFADFGCGSGCIAATLALENPFWHGIALDKSPAALNIARSNALSLGAQNLSFVLADFYSPPLPDASLELLVSNPPYISEAEYGGLDNEVKNFEPKAALVPTQQKGKETTELHDPDGMASIYAVILQAERLLRPEGLLLMEIGHTQASATLACLALGLWSKAEVMPDLAGLPRLLTATRTR